MIRAVIDKNAYPYGECTLDGNSRTVMQEFYNLNIMLIKSILDPLPPEAKALMYKDIIRKAMVEAFKDSGKQMFCGKEENDDTENADVAP